MLTFSHVIDRDRVSVMFSAKPDERIRGMLKANGFRWSPAGGFWWRRRVTGFADFLAALERAIGPRKPDGACWNCSEQSGFFRNEGPATPVRCDACQDKVVYFRGLPYAEQERYRTLAHGTELTPVQLAWTNRPAKPHVDRFDMDYEDRCAETCGL